MRCARPVTTRPPPSCGCAAGGVHVGIRDAASRAAVGRGLDQQTASISTSAPMGRVPTWKQERGVGGAEELGVDLVHGGEIGDDGRQDRRLGTSDYQFVMGYTNYILSEHDYG